MVHICEYVPRPTFAEFETFVKRKSLWCGNAATGGEFPVAWTYFEIVD